MGAGSSFYREMFGRAYKAKLHKVTDSPRTRPGQEYPGGKHMRKALAKLAMRHKRYGAGISRGHERGNSFYEPGSPSRRLPGSMNGKG